MIAAQVCDNNSTIPSPNVLYNYYVVNNYSRDYAWLCVLWVSGFKCVCTWVCPVFGPLCTAPIFDPAMSASLLVLAQMGHSTSGTEAFSFHLNPPPSLSLCLSLVLFLPILLPLTDASR